MAKPTKVILWVGFALATIVSFLMGYINYDHVMSGYSSGEAPQNLNFEVMLTVLLWFAFSFLPIVGIAGLTELSIRIWRRLQKKKTANLFFPSWEKLKNTTRINPLMSP